MKAQGRCFLPLLGKMETSLFGGLVLVHLKCLVRTVSFGGISHTPHLGFSLSFVPCPPHPKKPWKPKVKFTWFIKFPKAGFTSVLFSVLRQPSETENSVSLCPPLGPSGCRDPSSPRPLLAQQGHVRVAADSRTLAATHMGPVSRPSARLFLILP